MLRDALLEDRLVAEAADARAQPTAGLRRRTLAALQQTPTRATRRPDRPAPGAYALAAALVALLAAAAVMQLAPVPAPIETGEDPAPSGLAGIIATDGAGLESAVRLEVRRWETSVQDPLAVETRLMVDDAIATGEYLLARLPIPPGRAVGLDRRQ